jgi:hypothetical protein
MGSLDKRTKRIYGRIIFLERILESGQVRWYDSPK